MKRSLSILLLLGALGCDASGAPTPTGQQAAVVYDTDDRQDVYAHPSVALRGVAHDAIVALMRPSRLNEELDGSFTLKPTLTLGESYDLCADQRFVDQPTPAFCSGTLIAPDIVVTAGHCVTTQSQCLNTRLVFDYLYTAADQLSPLEADDVYSCVELLAQQDGVMDYAYLRLDRAVVGHAPATLADGLGTSCRNVVDEQPVAVLGFGSGLPLKIDTGGIVTNPSTRGSYFFNTSLDTFGGNSGSGVFNADHKLVGVLSRGAIDYRQRADAGCSEVNVLPERFGAEEVGHVLPTLVSYCETATAPDTTLCAHADANCGATPNDAGVDGGPSNDGGLDGGGLDDGGLDGGGLDGGVDPADMGITGDSAAADMGSGTRKRGCHVLPGDGSGAADGLWLVLGTVLLRRRRGAHERGQRETRPKGHA
ncbi:MAG: trypsin-like peptidase domain-containing protein [Sandaracinaceae bacterium]|nr:trypsin-like peptidase domain-containing protein [Sandaracinaceae bacterium]